MRTRNPYLATPYLTVALLIMLAVFTACEDRSAPDEGEERTENIAPEAQSDVEGQGGRSRSPLEAGVEENIVEVRLTEYEIDMPASLPEGVTDFLITNTGTAEHSFVMEGEGLEASLEANVRPGDTHQMRVDLQPGTYRVYCPVDDHSERGMALQLTVTVNDMDTGQAP